MFPSSRQSYALAPVLTARQHLLLDQLAERHPEAKVVGAGTTGPIVRLPDESLVVVGRTTIRKPTIAERQAVAGLPAERDAA